MELEVSLFFRWENLDFITPGHGICKRENNSKMGLGFRFEQDNRNGMGVDQNLDWEMAQIINECCMIAFLQVTTEGMVVLSHCVYTT